jgi:hypothetical protein
MKDTGYMTQDTGYAIQKRENRCRRSYRESFIMYRASWFMNEEGR